MRVRTTFLRRRYALSLAGLGFTITALSGCSTLNATSNAVVNDQNPVAAAQPAPDRTRAYATPNKLEIAQQRLTALIEEQRTATEDRQRSDELISTLKASASCSKESKSCTKKMALLTGERDRLDQRLKQLPAAISAAHTRVAQLQTERL